VKEHYTYCLNIISAQSRFTFTGIRTNILLNVF